MARPQTALTHRENARLRAEDTEEHLRHLEHMIVGLGRSLAAVLLEIREARTSSAGVRAELGASLDLDLGRAA